MKQKNVFTSKPFIIGALVVLCVVIIVICLILGSGDKDKFIPDPPQPSSSTDGWTESSPSGTGNGTYQQGQRPTSETPQYPIITSEDEDETEIDFTPSASSNPADLDPPSESGKPEDNIPHEEVPKPSEEDDVKPSAPPSGNPAPGSTNSQGQVYDPVFGWVSPGNVNQQDTDSDGDPNKQVGNMD